MNIDTQYLMHLLIKATDARIASITPNSLGNLSMVQQTRQEVMQDFRAILDTALDASVESGTQGGTVDRGNGLTLPTRCHVSVVIMMRHPENQRLGVWLAQRKEPGRFNGRWHCPGGGLKRNEEPEFGAARELREEMGLEVTVTALKFYRADMRDDVTYRLMLTHYTLGVGCSFNPRNTEPTIRTDWQWFPIDLPPGGLMPGLAPVLAQLAAQELVKAAPTDEVAP